MTQSMKQREPMTSMQEAMLRAMVKAGIDKRQQPIRPETLIPQSTKANSTFVPEKHHVAKTPNHTPRTDQRDKPVQPSQ